MKIDKINIYVYVYVDVDTYMIQAKRRFVPFWFASPPSTSSFTSRTIQHLARQLTRVDTDM